MSSRHVMLGVSAIVVVASAAMTIASGASMSAMGAMPMPGGWTMSHMWMVMPGQSWLGATASFIGMWTVMMVAMMLPSLVPTLLDYHESLGRRIGPARAGALTTFVGAAYFGVWAAVGLAVFPLGVAVADVVMREASVARAVPIVTVAIVVIAGLLQVSSRKTQYLAHCRETVGALRRAEASSAWHHGLCLGVHCVRACAALTVIALCLGVMDLRVMAALALWRFIPSERSEARVIPSERSESRVIPSERSESRNLRSSR